MPIAKHSRISLGYTTALMKSSSSRSKYIQERPSFSLMRLIASLTNGKSFLTQKVKLGISWLELRRSLPLLPHLVEKMQSNSSNKSLTSSWWRARYPLLRHIVTKRLTDIFVQERRIRLSSMNLPKLPKSNVNTDLSC